MSESKVPPIDRLPDGLAGWVCRYQVLTPHGWIGAWDKEAIEWYGDARAAEARRLALLEAAELCQAKYNEVRDAECKPGCDSHGHDADCYYAYPEEGLLDCAKRLRALADEASPKQVSG